MSTIQIISERITKRKLSTEQRVYVGYNINQTEEARYSEINYEEEEEEIDVEDSD